MATHSSILAWRIPGTEEPGGLQSMALQSGTRLSGSHSLTHSLAHSLTHSLTHSLRPFIFQCPHGRHPHGFS